MIQSGMTQQEGSAAVLCEADSLTLQPGAINHLQRTAFQHDGIVDFTCLRVQDFCLRGFPGCLSCIGVGLNNGLQMRLGELTAENNKMIGGIVGRAGSVNKDEDNDSGALSIEKCYVGTKDLQAPISNPYDTNNSNVTGKNAKVLIEGYGGLGGIISFADAGTKTDDNGKTYEGTVSFLPAQHTVGSPRDRKPCRAG